MGAGFHPEVSFEVVTTGITTRTEESTEGASSSGSSNRDYFQPLLFLMRSSNMSAYIGPAEEQPAWRVPSALLIRTSLARHYCVQNSITAESFHNLRVNAQ